MTTLSPGIYRLHWLSGGSSIAAVGVDRVGGNWMAPTNWVEPTRDSACSDWQQVVRAEPIFVDDIEDENT